MKPRKLTRREFARALRQGRGAAFLHVKEYGDRNKGIKEELLKACLTCLEYDSQLEGGRSVWIVYLLDLASDIKEYAGPIKTALEAALSSTSDIAKYDLQHLIYLGAALFNRGFGEFQSLLIKFCKHPAIQEDPYMLAEALIDVGAYFGLELVAELFESDKVENWERYLLYEYTCTYLDDKSDIDKFLEEKAKDNEAVAAFYQAVREEEKKEEEKRKHKAVQARTPIKPWTLSQVMQAIEGEEKPRRYEKSYYHFAKQASQHDLEIIAAKLETETDETRLYFYLYIFADRELPKVSNKVISLLFNKNHNLSRAAQNALSQVKAPAVRRVALTLLKDSKQRNKARGIDLLRKNFQLKDLRLVQEALVKFKQAGALHRATMDAIDLAKEVEDASIVSLLEWIHDATPCSRCRFRVIELLLERNCAPFQMLYEAQWDTKQGTVNLAITHLAKKLEV